MAQPEEEAIQFLDDAGRPSEIHKAAYDGDEKQLDKSLKGGSNVNKLDVTGATPLHYASFKGHIKIVKSLIRAGADVNRQDKDGKFINF